MLITKEEIRKLLLSVGKPGRYSGGEYGQVIKDKSNKLKVALSFPDLYEIGMSNSAIRIIYSILNSINGVACERVFAPAPDMENELRKRRIPLFSLESGTPLNEFDIIAFSIGYELAITNVLNILDTGRIPFKNKNRSGNDPIVIAGGPAIINPVPFSDFIDYFYIGEAEGELRELFYKIYLLKKKGAKREEIKERFEREEYIWYRGKNEKTKKAIYSGFGSLENYIFPIPSLKTVQNNGVIEIMRGCSNGCRFCQAGFQYRPTREKSIDIILQEAEKNIYDYGHREITLSSLSSGDYSRISELLDILNRKYESKCISFSLPSLKINSFTLPLLYSISRIRKSGLTFAIETPRSNSQIKINKRVDFDSVVKILLEARDKGWRSAKFYFMIGLPLIENEESDIINYLLEIRKKVKIKINANIGTFVPKPDTPFQWEKQIGKEEALEKIYKIKESLPGNIFKIGYNSPVTSYIEGIISRGDYRINRLIENVYKNGARLDAWNEFFKPKIWDDEIKKMSFDVKSEILGKRDMESKLPWDVIDSGVLKNFLIKENNKGAITTSICEENCKTRCGICNDHFFVKKTPTPSIKDLDIEKIIENESKKIIFSFTKKDQGIFLSHLDVLRSFEQALQRAGFHLKFSEGFNPKPKIEFANPLSLGIISSEEILSVIINNYSSSEKIRERINKKLPVGLRVIRVGECRENLTVRRKSLMAVYWGSLFSIKLLNQSLKDKVLSLLNENSLVIKKSKDDIIYTYIQQRERGPNNLRKILLTGISENEINSGLIMTREKIFAKDSEGNRIDYFSMYC